MLGTFMNFYIFLVIWFQNGKALRMKQLLVGLICACFLVTAYTQTPQKQIEEAVASSAVKSATPSPNTFKLDTGILFLRQDQEAPNLSRLELFDLTSGTSMSSSLSIGLGLSSSSEAKISQSPDGKWIAVKAGSQLFLVDASLQNHVIVPLEEELRFFAWSPDSSSLAILTGEDGYNPSLYFFSLESFYLDRFYVDGVRRPEVHKTVRSITWSPDGSRVILFSPEAGNLMYLVDTSTKALEQLTKEEMCGGNIDTITWSPDGEWIAIHFPAWNARGTYGRICAYNFAEKTMFPIKPVIHKSNPVWSIDSQSLYFVINTDSDMEDGPYLMRFSTIDRQITKAKKLPPDHRAGIERELIGLLPDGRSLFFNLTSASQLGSRISIISLDEATKSERSIEILGEIRRWAWQGEDMLVFTAEEDNIGKMGRFYRVNFQTGATTLVSDLLPEREWELFIQPQE